MLDRMKRDQLDGIGSGGVLCQRLAPSMRVTRLVGLFRSRTERQLVLTPAQGRARRGVPQGRLRQSVGSGPGHVADFSRTPVTHAGGAAEDAPVDLGSRRSVRRRAARRSGAGGAHVAGGRGARLRQRKLDGYITMPVAALAFQWSAQTRYFTDLPMGFLSGCLLIASHAFDALPVEQQQAIRQAAPTLQARMEDVGREQDAAAARRRALQTSGPLVRAGDAPRSATAFYAAAQAARDRDASVTAGRSKAEVEAWLKEYPTLVIRWRRVTVPAASSLDFALRFVDGRGLLNLRTPQRLDWVGLEKLELEIPNLRFPFDVSGGPTRFQTRRCHLARRAGPEKSRRCRPGWRRGRSSALWAVAAARCVSPTGAWWWRRARAWPIARPPSPCA